MTQIREIITQYISDTYHAAPEYLWKSYPSYAIFRRKDNEKWFAIVMDVDREKLGLSGEGREDVLNVKLADPVFLQMLLNQSGYLPAYHMSKAHWITILLDGTVSVEKICGLIDGSYADTAPKKHKSATSTAPKTRKSSSGVESRKR